MDGERSFIVSPVFLLCLAAQLSLMHVSPKIKHPSTGSSSPASRLLSISRPPLPHPQQLSFLFTIITTIHQHRHHLHLSATCLSLPTFFLSFFSSLPVRLTSPTHLCPSLSSPLPSSAIFSRPLYLSQTHAAHHPTQLQAHPKPPIHHRPIYLRSGEKFRNTPFVLATAAKSASDFSNRLHARTHAEE